MLCLFSTKINLLKKFVVDCGCKLPFQISSFTARLTASATRGQMLREVLSSLRSSSATSPAIAFAVASFISSVTCAARPSRAPLKMPGNATTLLTDSENPTTGTDNFCTGSFCQIRHDLRNRICHCKEDRILIHGSDHVLCYNIRSRDATKISAPFKASARVPVFSSRLVTSAICFCIQFRLERTG